MRSIGKRRRKKMKEERTVDRRGVKKKKGVRKASIRREWREKKKE